MPHWICGVVIRSVITENGSGGSSPGCISTADQSIVVPSSLGGVPVFSRPSVKPARSNDFESPIAGASSTRPAGQFFSPRWINPRRKVPVVMTTALARKLATIGQADASNASAGDNQFVGLPFNHAEIGGLRDGRLHRRRIELAIGLGARTPHGWALAPIEHSKLNAARHRQRGPSARRAHRPRGQGDPCRGPRSQDCRTSRLWSRSDGLPAPSWRPCARLRSRLRSRRDLRRSQ